MIGSDLLRAACMAAPVVVVVANGAVVLIPAHATVCTAAGAPYMPCVLAVLPRVVDDELPAANAACGGITPRGSAS